MKMVSQVARVLLGVVFLVFGLNGFLHFLPMGPLPAGSAGQFIGALAATHYITVVFAIQLVSGVLLLMNHYVPLALTMLAAVIVNIDLFHALMAPSGIPLAALATALWMLTTYNYRSIFSNLLRRRVPV